MKYSYKTITYLLLMISVICYFSTPLCASGINAVTGHTFDIKDNKWTIDGDITNAGTLKTSSGTLSLTGNWTNTGVFNAGRSGTVAFPGSIASTITGANTFANFTCTQSGKQLSFEAGKTQTISSTWTLTGSSRNLIKLRSTGTGTQWKIDPEGTRNVSYADVKDSNNISSTAINPTNSTDSGNNTNWFPAAIPTPTPTPSPTATSTPTPSPTPSPTATSTPTPSPTPSPTATSTPTPSPTPTPTATSTPTPSPTPSPTATSTPTPSPTPSPTATSTPTPSPTPTVGTGIVFGFVIDEDDNPLKGVTVTITGNNSSVSTETDDDGYYEFSGLKAGDYTLTYKKDGYQTQTRSVILEEGEVKDLGTVTMEQVVSGKIYGNVVDIKGNPLEAVRLKLKGIKTKVIKTASSDADGFFEFEDLEPDTYRIAVTKKFYKKINKVVKLEEGEDKEMEIVMKKTSKRIKELLPEEDVQ